MHFTAVMVASCATVLATLLLLQSAEAQGGESSDVQFVTNPFPEQPPQCCVQDELEVCSPQSEHYGVTDPGCAAFCYQQNGNRPLPTRCEGRKCVCLEWTR